MTLARVTLAVLILAGFAGPAPALRPAVAASPPDSPSPPTSLSPPPAPSTPAPPDPLEEFVPREKVPADSAVSFPVDI
jgi:hypothetical protein